MLQSELEACLTHVTRTGFLSVCTELRVSQAGLPNPEACISKPYDSSFQSWKFLVLTFRAELIALNCDHQESQPLSLDSSAL